MKKQSNNSGKWIAVIMILVFFGINYFKQDEAGPQEQIFAKQKQDAKELRAIDDKIAPPQNVEKLKYAYTGNWEKNAPGNPGQYVFSPPQNARNQIHPTAAKKQDDKKKKKVAKKKTTKKIAKKKSRGKSMFDWNNDDSQDTIAGYNANSGGYYGQPNRNQNVAQPEEKKEKKLTAQEWIAAILESGTVAEFVNQYKSGEVNKAVYIAVTRALLGSADDTQKRLGFDVLAQVQTAESLDWYAEFIETEMSAETKEYAQNTLKAYSNPNLLRILNNALSYPKSEVRVLAANLIKDIVTTILAEQPNSGERSPAYSEQQIENYRTLLAISRSVIDNAIAAGISDTQVASSFRSTLETLSLFLS